MAMEVVWARAFTPVLRTQVYSFASIVFCYLAATGLGSWLYRRDLRRSKVIGPPNLLSFLAVAALLPVLVDDFRLLPREWRGPMDPASVLMILTSIGPLCAILGYLTPSLIDSFAGGDPGDAGKAYALNVLGCILGPLFACYIMLPRIGERYALVLLSLPLLLFWLLHSRSLAPARRWQWGTAAGIALLFSIFITEDFPARVLRLGKHTQIRRDYSAFVVSVGENREKLLMVNGMDMTVLSPVTKYMVHLPLALHQGKVESVLIICFGMGTTHRSALSWDVDTTTVELVPSVRDAFPFYHADAADVLRDPKGRIMIDDGRRFLRRTDKQYDVIVLDPPPPVMAAGSSLLYSSEFYELAKQHLKPNGILQTWVPRHNIEFAPAIFRSLYEAFPYTRCFKGLEAGGYHLLGSMQPIPVPSAADFVARVPPRAQKDLLEWSVSHNLTADVHEVLAAEIAPKTLLNPDPHVRITDDRPYNEYYLLRYFQ
jgi:spermidine synthase